MLTHNQILDYILADSQHVPEQWFQVTVVSNPRPTDIFFYGLSILFVHLLTTPGCNAAWWVTSCRAADIYIYTHTKASTFDDTSHSEKMLNLTTVLFGKWLCQF
jgi:hypothetical protein